MKEMEEQYKNYLDKAKSVIKTLDPKQAPSPADDNNEGNQQEVFPFSHILLSV